MKHIYLITLFLSFEIGTNQSFAQNQFYFPPNGTDTWDTLSPTALGWCQSNIDELYAYLQQTNTKAFLLLKDGKIVLEKYFGNFTQDSIHVWNSAGKTLTATLVGSAINNNLMHLDSSSRLYLGANWSSLTDVQEKNIKLKNHVTMTTGLDDSGNLDCTDPQCLTYLADAGSRWSYHNAPYTLTTYMIENVAGQNINNYYSNQIGSTIGAPIVYYTFGFNRVAVSKPRSMARFGLLLLAKGKWNGATVLDSQFVIDLSNTSQNINLSYGYLTWLNGKTSYMVPQSQFVIPGPAMANAPLDLYAALGKNSQILNVVNSNGMVLVRMGDHDGVSLVSTQYNDTIWQKISALPCNMGLNGSIQNVKNTFFFPNPSDDGTFQFNSDSIKIENIFSLEGRRLEFEQNSNLLKIKYKGFFLVEINANEQKYFVKIHHQ